LTVYKHICSLKRSNINYVLESNDMKRQEKIEMNRIFSHVNKSINRNDVWEIDASCLNYEKKIASGSVSDL